MAEPSPSVGDYPDRWESDVVLADGGTVHIRPIRPTDRERLAEFHDRQSSESIYYRFFSPHPRLTERDLDRFTAVDYVSRMAFVAMLGDDIIGMASYDHWHSGNEAEVSFIVDDEQQGRGLATVLLEYLIVAAREVGFAGLTATVLPNNRRMLAVLHSAGFQARSTFADGLIEVSIALEPTAEALTAVEERARVAEARSVRRLLSPSSVAVIGAGRAPGTVGHELFRGILHHGFTGAVYPVNASGEPVAGVRSYPSVLDIPDVVDVAVVAVPALAVLDVVEACGHKGVGGLVIASAGFAEYGPYGEAGIRLIVERARRYGMRVIGPESLGIINTAPAVSLHAVFSDVDVSSGRVGFLTQSGTLGMAALAHLRRVGLGVSSFVDVGSKVDVSGNDVLQYWAVDDRTDVVAMYLESFGNPRKFTRIARRLARTTPIVAVKSRQARLLTGEAAARTGLGAWPVAATTAALLEQSGVIRVDSPTDLFDVCRLLAVQPPPAGNRVAIVSNSEGATALTVDACADAGLVLAELAEVTRGAISAADIPRGAIRQNPVDLTFAAGPAAYEATIAAVLADPGVDAVVVIYAPSFPRRSDEVARAIGGASAQTGRVPVVATFLGADPAEPLAAGPGAIPLFEFPAEAVRVLGHAARYAAWRSQPDGVVPEVDDLEGCDLPAARELVRRHLAALAEGTRHLDGVAPGGDGAPDGWLDPASVRDLLELIGLPLFATRLVEDADAAAAAADELGYPVVLKATGLQQLRPGEEGGVALELHDGDEVRDAFARMAERFGAQFSPAMVQPQVAGAEVQVAVHQHASYGGIVTLGLGGPARSANVEPALRVLPLSDQDAVRLVAASPVSGLVAGVPAPDPAGDASDPANELVRLLLRLAVVADHLPELADVVLNPVSVTPEGARVLDARVRVAPYRWDPAPAVRRLS